MLQPLKKPQRPYFSSGPCAKHSDWSVDQLRSALVGRSHRSKLGKERLKLLIDKVADILKIPHDYYVGIVPASDTGAVEMAMWSMLGYTAKTNVLVWESFSKDWAVDIEKQLKLEVNLLQADYGQLPDLTRVDHSYDTVFCYNGTTSGVRVPDLGWIADDRQGITICDATSAVFAYDMDWSKLDVTTFSWQKVLGGEAQHGILILSPRAVARLENYTPPWPLPKIFRLTKSDKLNEGIFKGATINTPSMLCVEDTLKAIEWLNANGGLDFALQTSARNLAIVRNWVAENDWIDFLCEDEANLSSTSICLKITAADFNNLALPTRQEIVKKTIQYLESEYIAYDIGSYRDAPLGLRLWGGATVTNDDMEALLPWITWTFKKILSEYITNQN